MQESTISLEKIYVPSKSIVAREIQGEFIIVSISSGIADVGEEIFSLNDTGRSIWDKLDGRRKLKEVIKDLSHEYESSYAKLQKDVIGVIEELHKRYIVVEAKKN